jgi:hypothetical protein
MTITLYLERPSQVAFFLQTSPAAQNWWETRCIPMMKKNKKIVALFPTNKHHIKKDVIIWPHMTMWCRGSTISLTQSLSLDAAIIDEAWVAPADALQYISRRRHDRAFNWMLATSQAGNTSSEFYDWCQDSKRFEYNYKCPQCQQFHPWKFTNLSFDKNFENVYYKCPCGAELNDTPQNRRAMSCEGKYIEIPTENVNSKRVTYNFNAGLNYSVSWETLAREFVKANNEAKKFNYEPLRLFRNQRLSEWWDDSEVQFMPVETSEYSINDKVKSDITLMSVDVQGELGDTLMWFEVRTFNKESGESKLLEFGRFAAYEDIPRKQAEWGIPGNCVAIDCAWKTDEVREFSAIHGYLTLNGISTNVFPVNLKGRNVNRIYGTIRKEKTLKGRFASYAPYSSTRTKVVCAGLRSSKVWLIPHDAPEHYIKQLGAEIYDGGKWVQKRKDNHALDTSAMLLILALVHGVHVNVDTQETTETAID